MQSIIEELYNGNIRLGSKIYDQDSLFVKAARVKHNSMEKLTATLDDSEKELLEKYFVAQSEMEEIVKFDNFVYALKFGILLMIEIFADRWENISVGGEKQWYSTIYMMGTLTPLNAA